MNATVDKVPPTDEDRARMQSHYPYTDIKLNQLSVQEERLVLLYLRGMSKAAAGRAAGYADIEHVYKVFKREPVQRLLDHMRNEMREDVKFDRTVATTMYMEAHRKSANATEEVKCVDSLCRLHGLVGPEKGVQVNINMDSVEQLERLPDSELLKIAGVDNQYLLPKGGKKDERN